MLGAHSQELDVDADHYPMFKEEFKGVIEANAGKTYNEFEPLKFTKQVVAGMVFKIKYKVDDGKYILVKMYKPLPHMNQAPEVMEFTEDQAENALDEFAV